MFKSPYMNKMNFTIVLFFTLFSCSLSPPAHLDLCGLNYLKMKVLTHLILCTLNPNGDNVSQASKVSTIFILFTHPLYRIAFLKSLQNFISLQMCLETSL